MRHTSHAFRAPLLALGLQADAATHLIQNRIVRDFLRLPELLERL